MVTERDFEKIKRCMKMKVLAKRSHFFNGHVYTVLWMWEITSSTKNISENISFPKVEIQN